MAGDALLPENSQGDGEMKKLVLLLSLVASPTPAQVAENAIDDAKTRIAATMKDPESVRFADLTSSSKDGTSIVCGWINAKNSYGGYVGFTPFIVTDTYVAVRSKEPRSSFASNRAKFDEVWTSCTPDDDQPLGESLVEVQDLKVEKYCKSLAKYAKKEDRQSRTLACVKHEHDARAWLETHKTSAAIASACSIDARRYYSSGKSCVLDKEASITFGRGPKVVAADQ